MSMPPRSRTGSGALLAGLIIAAVVVVAIVVLAASGATPSSVWNSFFPNHGTGGVTDRSTSVQNLYDFVFYIAVAIFLLVEGLIVWSVFRYRRKSTDTDLPPQTHGNNLVEVIWTVIPTAIVIVLFAMSWQSLNTVDAKVPTDVTVRAVAARFQWSFDYLDGNGPEAKTLFTVALPVGDTGGMVLPVGEPVHVELRSDDVIHAFYVPKFLFKRDVVPGRNNTFDFTVEEAGTYRGQCAELCGAFHGSMIFDVHAVPRADYDVWLAEQIAKANATPPPAPSGEAAGPGAPADGPEHRVHGDDAGRAGRRAVHDPLQQQRQRRAAQRRDQGRERRRRSSRARPSTASPRRDYAVPPLANGTYLYVCTVHPNMTGNLTVK